MKHVLIIFISLGLSLSMHAQTISTDSLSQPILTDSAQHTLSSDSLTADTTFFDETISHVDTTQCATDTLLHALPDSIYRERLMALPFVMETPYNQIVRAFILRYVQQRPKQLAAMQRKAEYYFPIFADILEKNGLPYELCYLAVIESALNPTAYSRMGAAGLWQFMPSTGRLFGLEINSLVDERMDPIKSTEAACRYLCALYDKFDDWNLALASYNCGPGNVKKAIARAGGKRDFWSIYPYLPRETRSYVPIFIAASYAMNYADLHGICPEATEMTLQTDTVQSDKRQHLTQISEVMGISMDELRRLNPQYRRDVIPGGKPYSICLPTDKVDEYIIMQDSILNFKADSLINNRRAEIDMAQQTSISGYYGNGVYKVKKGDTLSGIAKKFHCTVKQLKQWNGLKSDNIQIGKTLKIKK